MLRLHLMLNPRNPRTRSDIRVGRITGNILAFGFNAPILVDAEGGIIAGPGRYLAALKLGLETAPVIALADRRNGGVHSNGRGRIRHNGPTPRRKAGNHGD